MSAVKYVRRDDLPPLPFGGAASGVSRVFAPLGKDWPRWRFSIECAAHDVVLVHIAKSSVDGLRFEDTNAVPRPLLDELSAVIAEACGRLPRETHS